MAESSATPTRELSKKLAFAASGFSNTGGGLFLAGVDATGNADGGIPLHIGRQDLRDWVDQVIHQVLPHPNYEVVMIEDAQGRGTINNGHAVLAVIFSESLQAPHMAPDNRYYIRAGAHTVGANHFIVEAIWAKRNTSSPRITHTFRTDPQAPKIVQFGLVALGNAPAIDIKITLQSDGKLFRKLKDFYPIRTQVIDQRNPFFMDVSTWEKMEERFGSQVQLSVEYSDLAGNLYEYNEVLEIGKSFGPINFFPEKTQS